MPAITTRHEKVNPYPNNFLFLIDEFCLWIIKVYRIPLDEFLSSFVPTTEDCKNKKLWILKRVLMMPIILPALMLAIPFGLLAFIIWLTFQHKKTPYRLSIASNPNSYDVTGQDKDTFSFATVNLCLLPQCASRFNNQTDPGGRSRKQGQRIALQQAHAHSMLRKNINSDSHSLGTAPGVKRATTNGFTKDAPDLDVTVLEQFPPLDILLIQEAWIKEYTEALIDELHAVFPYIVYDVGINTWASNCFHSNSGLMIASRYPMMEIRFDPYSHGVSQCRLASKGLLQIKVLVKETPTKKYVGYAYTTHLQAYQGTRPIHKYQLNDVHRWATRFRETTQKPNEVVVFDVLGGDFNLDNSSPVDREDWSHPIFEMYKDNARICPGMDQPWAVGTEMAHTPLHDALIQTPAGLKRALDDPLLLQYYVMDGTIEDLKYAVAWDMPECDEHGRQKWHRLGGKRRIDYVMHRAIDTHVRATAHNPVTQLAGLTDHIPYSLTLRVSGLPHTSH